MKVDIGLKHYYLGRDENGKPIVDFENSGEYILGVFANIQATTICLIKAHDNKIRWEILDDFTINVINIDLCLKKSSYFIEKYNIKYVFGNKIGNTICNIKNNYSLKDNSQYEGYEIVELDSEYMTFLVLGNQDKLIFNKNLKENWEKEFKNYNIDDLRNNRVTYSRIFALAAVLEAADPKVWYLYEPNIPNVVIDSKTGQIIKDNRAKRNQPGYTYL